MALNDRREQRIDALRRLARRSKHYEEAQLFNQLAEFYERQARPDLVMTKMSISGET
jgi:hypothetical protein